MTDVFDRAQEADAKFREQALAAQAARPHMPFNGQCYNCAEPVAAGCFCGADCRDDYELRIKQKRA